MRVSVWAVERKGKGGIGEEEPWVWFVAGRVSLLWRSANRLASLHVHNTTDIKRLDYDRFGSIQLCHTH